MTINPPAILNSTALGNAASVNQRSVYSGQTTGMPHPPGFSHPTGTASRSHEVATRSSAAVAPGQSRQRQTYSGASPVPARGSGRTPHGAHGPTTTTRSDLSMKAETVRYWQERYSDGGYFVYRNVRTSTIKAALQAPYNNVLPDTIGEFITTAIINNRVRTSIYLFLLLSQLLYHAEAFVI